MSGIAGIYNLDGKPVESKLLADMADCIAYRGPDAKKIWSDNCIGFCHTLLRTTPESKQECQPNNLNGRIWIVADARIDNRAELEHKLEAKGCSALELATDAKLILFAYQVWGRKCVQYLLGDFVFAIWDGNQRNIFCARDHVGIKQLYYYIDKRKFVFATDISAILCVLPQRPALNELLLLDFLSDQYHRWYTETSYENIFKLKPSHFFTVDDKLVQSSYYDFGLVKSLSYKSEAEYIEHFREVFTEAVSCRTRSITPVGLEVSGGVDSSSVASLLKHLHVTNKLQLDQPTLYSYVNKKFSCADERQYLSSLLTTCSPWPVRLLDGDQMWALKDYDNDRGFPADEPEISLIRRNSLDLMRQVNSDGIRVLINGYGGDQVLLGDAYYMSDLLPQLTFGSMLSEWSYFKKKRDWSHHKLLVYGLLKPYLRNTIPGNIQNFLHKLTKSRRYNSPDWLLNHVGSGSSDIGKDGQFANESGVRLSILRSILEGYWQKGLAGLDFSCGLWHVERRYPYLDKRVIEFILSIPHSLLFRQGSTKWILRQSLTDILPETIRNRTTFATCNELVDLGWRIKEKDQIKRMLEAPATSARGWVDRERLRGAWKAYWNGDDRQVWCLNAWLNTELWLKGRCD